ncbi:hypothetical protein N431DRAFT_457438 [Stipitochalara longipes BDJ]|nr:hypothetical protein N431DRAFT_457438 [Stipitochalara longipes BDJ]
MSSAHYDGSRQELATKDCRVCNRRRIKCDRRLPTCGKCEKRGLTCSGYGVLLKWDQGVASRGKLKGQSLPIKTAEKSAPASYLTEVSKSSMTRIPRSGDQLQEITPSFSLQMNTIPKSLLPFQIQSSDERHLLHHYDHIVASNMAWADCHENPWRHIIIPLALESPPLLNAILAFAAKHINAISMSASKESTAIMHICCHERFQQKAVKLLAREIQEFATERDFRASSNIPKDISHNRSNAILATMLVLCNVETVWPDSSYWQVHLNAARTVIASFEDTISSERSKDSTSVFLEQELFIANTFASTTNFLDFTVDENFNLNTNSPKSGNIFIEFLKLLQMVTSLQRQAITSPGILANPGVSPSGLRKLFEHARSQTLAVDGTSQTSASYDYLHLSRTVNCFYHAGLIHSYRALLRDELLDLDLFIEKQTQLTTSKFELFRALGFAETNKPTFAQDLVWPLFIAGTEAIREDEQEMVIAKLQQAISETGFSNCQHALEFLDAFWQQKNCDERQGNKSDWIAFAREWAGQGKTFLVF